MTGHRAVRSAPMPPSTTEVPAVTVAEAGDRDAELWNAYLDRSSRATLYHRYEWRHIIARAFGKRSVYLAARGAQREWFGVLPLVHLSSRLFGNFLVSMPYVNYGGIVAESAQAAQALADHAAGLAHDLGCSYIEYRHTDAGVLDLPSTTRKVSMVLPLPAAVDALWAGFKPKLRAQVRRAGKAGAAFEIGGAELLPDFYAVFAENMRDLGTPVYSRRFFEAVFAGVGTARVGVVRLEGRPVAAGIVLGHRSTLEIPWAASRRRFNALSPNMLLYGSLLEWAIEQGYTEFDFGRSSRDSGTYRFKQQWGAAERPLVWHYWQRQSGPLPELNPESARYALLVRAWQRLPVAATRLIGPHIVKNLP
jgi:serine/alanine adding enzyme